MELFLSYLNRHISGSEHRLRTRMKKLFDKVSRDCITSAGPAYRKWLSNKLTTYFPEYAAHHIDQENVFQFDEPVATSWAIKNIPDFEFLVQMIAASHFFFFFGKWITIEKHVSNIVHSVDTTDFEF